MQSRPARLARGLVAGGFAVLTAAVSHTLAGAEAPSALALLVALVFAGLLGTAVTAARPSLPRLAALVGASQVAFHLGFVLLGASGSITGGHHGAPLDLDGIASAPAHAHLDTAGMWVAHVIAAVVTIGMLRLAESAAWTLLVRLAGRLALAVLRAIRCPSLPRAARRIVLDAVDLPAQAGERAASSHHRRGPPSLSFA